ncbi:MAG: AI-2E family transporter [Caldilinea sp. CFX5]|nr:AI-2E family transporter [Caldilinea sp. CFX5]
MPANSTVEAREYPAPEALTNTTATRSRITFYILFAIMSLLMFWLVRTYLGVIAFSLLTVIVLRPLYIRFLRWCNGWEKPAMSLTLLVGLALPLLLVWIVGRMVIAQAQEFLDLIQRTNQIELLTGSITAYLQPLLTSDDPLALDLVTQLREVLLLLFSWVAGSLVTLGMSIPTLLTELFVYLILVGALLPTYEPFVQWLKELSPLDDAIEDLFLRKINGTVQSMFAGIFLIAVVQGAVLGLFFWLVDLPYTPLWTLVSIVAATMPLGASIVAIPAALAELLAGHYGGALVILIGYFAIVSNLDLLIRSKLVSLQTYGSFALMVLSLLGGYQLFGLFGVFYGPILMVLFLTMLDVYQTHFAQTPITTPTGEQAGDEAL